MLTSLHSFTKHKAVSHLIVDRRTGLLSPQFAKHLDHIVPLAEGGINDVANLQLLCAPCNNSKGGHRPATSNMYETWYDEREHRGRF